MVRHLWILMRPKKSQGHDEVQAEEISKRRYNFMPSARWDMLQALEATQGDVRQADWLYAECTISKMWEWIATRRTQQWEPKRRKRPGVPFGSG